MTLTRTAAIETILGYRAERLDTTTRRRVSWTAAETRPAWIPDEITMRFTEWCAADLALPPPLVEMLRTAGAPGMSLRPSAAFVACPLPLRSRVGSSLDSGFESVTRVVSIQDEQVSPSLFTLPKGYKEVPPPW